MSRCPKKAKIEVGFFISNAAPTRYDRNPVRHATVKMPLQSESSLKYHLQLLRAARGSSIVGFPYEWAATATFALGDALGRSG